MSRLRLGFAIALWLTVSLVGVGRLRAQNTDARLRELEERLKSVEEKLERVLRDLETKSQSGDRGPRYAGRALKTGVK